jgi:hypothetical protein
VDVLTQLRRSLECRLRRVGLQLSSRRPEGESDNSLLNHSQIMNAAPPLLDLPEMATIDPATVHTQLIALPLFSPLLNQSLQFTTIRDEECGDLGLSRRQAEGIVDRCHAEITSISSMEHYGKALCDLAYACSGSLSLKLDATEPCVG